MVKKRDEDKADRSDEIEDEGIGEDARDEELDEDLEDEEDEDLEDEEDEDLEDEEDEDLEDEEDEDLEDEGDEDLEDEEDEDLEDEEDEDLEDEEDEEDEDLEDEEDEDLEDEEYDEDEEDEDEEGDDYDDERGLGAEAGAEDPFWWTPHLVLAVLLLAGLLGFFGFFNEWLGFLAAKPDHDTGAASAATSTPAAPPVQPTVNPRPARSAAAKPQGEIYGAKHILVQYKGSMRAGAKVERDKAAAKKRAAECAAKAKKTASEKDPAARSEAWKKLVTEYSDEPGADKRGGDLGRFRPGSFHPQFVDGVKKIKVGSVSDPVETPFGFHIIWRTL